MRYKCMTNFARRFLSVGIILLGLSACAQIGASRDANNSSVQPVTVEKADAICNTQSVEVAKVEYITVPAELETITEYTVDTGHWGADLIKIPAEYNIDGSLKTPERVVMRRDIYPFPTELVERQVIKTPSYELKRTTMHNGTVKEVPLSAFCSRHRSGTLKARSQ